MPKFFVKYGIDTPGCQETDVIEASCLEHAEQYAYEESLQTALSFGYEEHVGGDEVENSEGDPATLEYFAEPYCPEEHDCEL